MHKNYKNIAIALLLIITACSHMASIENVTDASIPAGTHKLSEKEIGNVIAKSAIERGWSVSQIAHNKLHATLNIHNTQAQVDITYTAAAYSISYVSSQNFEQQGTSISPAYNRYIDYLNMSISKALNAAAF